MLIRVGRLIFSALDRTRLTAIERQRDSRDHKIMRESIGDDGNYGMRCVNDFTPGVCEKFAGETTVAAT